MLRETVITMRTDPGIVSRAWYKTQPSGSYMQLFRNPGQNALTALKSQNMQLQVVGNPANKLQVSAIS